jgi:hypothetical protein
MRARWVATAGVLGALAALAAVAGPAGADQRSPAWVSDATIEGTPTSGEVLTGHATWGGRPAPDVSFYWLRCEGASEADCAVIAGANAQTYTLTDADVGRQVVFVVLARNRYGSDWGFARTPAIAAKPAPPAPKPSPSPSPVAVKPPDIAPPKTSTPAAPAGGVEGAGAALRWLSPFPVVRIRGWLTPSGAKVTLLTVRAPRRAQIRVRCSGRDCPRRRYARATKLVQLTPYQRLLRGSMRLEISVTRKGYVGKRTIITLRRGKAPARRDLCLYPGVRKAKACR